tara:strand:- start:377 stop:799 length:423 start_codon:yes stop_codon:yes gene_type:complete
VKESSFLKIPLAIESISAGFPSPAEDYLDTGIDLNEELIQHPTSTFFLRVSGHSMTKSGIYDGDLLIVDRSIDPHPGRIVIAILDGSFTVKRLTRVQEKLYLEASYPDYPAIDISRYETVQIWGVAIYCIHDLSRISKSL